MSPEEEEEEEEEERENNNKLIGHCVSLFRRTACTATLGPTLRLKSGVQMLYILTYMAPVVYPPCKSAPYTQ